MIIKMRWFLLVCGVVVLNVSLSAQVNLEILRTHAERGLVSAQYQLGYLYATGDEGVTQDYAEAVRWSQLAADQGHAAAQYNLGYMYATGAGVDLDDAEAIRWYRLAAEQGEARAQYDLGHRYATGTGVPLDTGEAARWWRQAGEQGYRDAQTALEQLDQLSQQHPTTEEDLELANKKIPSSEETAQDEPDLASLIEEDQLPIPDTLDTFVPTPELQIPASNPVVAYDLSAMYAVVNPSIAQIYADGSKGSGFLIDSRGLIATNHHVIRNSRYLAVQFANGEKHQAAAVVADAEHDVAILRVHKDVIRGISSIPLLPRAQLPTLQPGTPVVAFGSPLGQTFLVTQGIVSKVADSYLLGDYLISSGSSGGPLLNLNGTVIGINTFAVGGISGAVPVSVLKDWLEVAVTAMDSTELAELSADPLPMVPTEKYPADALLEKLQRPSSVEQESYQLDGGRFTITALTPVHMARRMVLADRLQASNRLNRRQIQAEEIVDPFYEWVREAVGNQMGFADYVVKFVIEPDTGTTSGTKWANFATALLTGINNSQGNYTDFGRPRQTMEYKAEFHDFKLYRYGVLVQPIHPGRMLSEQMSFAHDRTFVDEAYSGFYSYPVDIFMTGSSYTLEVFDARRPNSPDKVIQLTDKSELIRQIRQDFLNADPHIVEGS